MIAAMMSPVAAAPIGVGWGSETKTRKKTPKKIPTHDFVARDRVGVVSMGSFIAVMSDVTGNLFSGVHIVERIMSAIHLLCNTSPSNLGEGEGEGVSV